MRLSRLVLPLAIAFLAPAAPAYAENVQVQDDVFTPDQVQVAPGATQSWLWTAAANMHDVVSNTGQTDRFRSKLQDGTGKTFSHAFRYPGRFRYFCEVHVAAGMKGVVQVGTPESVPPVLSSISASPRRARRTVKVRLTLDERSVVTLTLKRGSRRAKRVTKVLSAGRRSISVSVRRLKAGRYSAQLQAKDGWGNRSNTRTARFRVVH